MRLRNVVRMPRIVLSAHFSFYRGCVMRIASMAILAATGLCCGCTLAPDVPSEDVIVMADVVDRVRCELKFVTRAHPSDSRRDAKLLALRKKYAKRFLAENERAYPRTRFAVDDLLDTVQEAKVRRFAQIEYESDPANAQYRVGNFLNTLAVQFELTMQVKDTNGIGSNAASATWGGIPIPLGVFSFRASGGLQGAARRTAKYKLSFYLKEAREWDHIKRCKGFDMSRPSDIRLDGAFGVDNFILRSVQTSFASDDNHFNSISTAIVFTLSPSVGVAPTWSISQPNGRTFNGTFSITANRDYENTLDFVVSAIAEPFSSEGVSRVVVTNLPPEFGPLGVPGADPERTRSREENLKRQLEPRSLKGRVDPLTQQRLDNELFRLQVPNKLLGQ